MVASSILEPAGRQSGGGPAALAAGAPAGPAAEPAALQREIAALKAELNEINARWSALYQIGVLLTRQMYGRAVLTQIVEQSMHLLRVEQAVLLELDPVTEDLVVRAVATAYGEEPLPVGLRIKPGEGLTGLAYQTGRPQMTDEYCTWNGRIPSARAKQTRAALAVPLVGGRGKVGALGVASLAEGRRFTEQDVQALELLAQQAAAILDAAAARRVEQELMVRSERRRLAQWLHDGAQQRVATMLLKIDRCQAQLHADQEALYDALDELAADLQETLQEMRSLATVLHEAELHGRGLELALRLLAEQRAAETGLRIRLDAAALRRLRLSSQAELAVMRLAREALNNAYKHAQASEVHIKIEQLATGAVHISVADNGCGIPPPRLGNEAPKVGLGLISLREQIGALHGEFGLNSAPGQGVTVWAIIPAEEIRDADTNLDRR